MAVVGCLIHALAVTVSLYIYKDSGPGGSAPPDFPILILIFAVIWPFWGFAVWGCAVRTKIIATIIPMLVGLLVISPAYLFFFLLLAISSVVPQ